jgi:hypothetical protein
MATIVARKMSHTLGTYDVECNFYTQIVISTRSVISISTIVIPTRTSVNSTRTRLVSAHRVFLHTECDFTRRVCFLNTRE